MSVAFTPIQDQPKATIDTVMNKYGNIARLCNILTGASGARQVKTELIDIQDRSIESLKHLMTADISVDINKFDKNASEDETKLQEIAKQIRKNTPSPPQRNSPTAWA
jgi:hypothetical protein